MDQAKGLLQSRTFWWAALQAAAGVIAAFATAYPMVGWLMVAKSILDIYLRATTTQPISGVLPRIRKASRVEDFPLTKPSIGNVARNSIFRIGYESGVSPNFQQEGHF